MSFRTTGEVLGTFRDRFLDAYHWCASLNQKRSSPEFGAASASIVTELQTRAKSFQAAIDSGETKTLKTFLQYEPREELRKALDTLRQSEPQDAESLFADVSQFYDVIFQGLTECQTTAEGTPAAILFAELEKEAHAGISSLSWKLRPHI